MQSSFGIKHCKDLAFIGESRTLLIVSFFTVLFCIIEKNLDWSCVLTQVSLNGLIELVDAQEEKANFLSVDEKMEKPTEEHEMARRRNGSSASTARVRPME